MKKFYITTLFFIILIILTYFLLSPFSIKIIAIGIIFFLYLAILFWASYNIRSGFYIKCFNKNSIHKNKVAISFDDGPDPINTPLILNILKKYNAKASFFIIGSKAENNINLIKEIHSQNHLIANHSFNHSNWFPLKKIKIIKEEILKTNKIIFEATGNKNKYFRPPFGVTNPNIAKAANQLGLIVVGWSVRSFDTKNENSEIVLKRIIKKIKGGDIILLHDKPVNSPEILEKLLAFMQQNNITSVSIDELITNKEI